MKFTLSLLLIVLTWFAKGQDLPTKATDTRPLMNGQDIPESTLQDLDGNNVQVSKLISSRPSMIIFYRGSWCPYCNRQLAGLQEVEDQIRELGFQVIAISPDRPENMRKTVDQNKLSYVVLSDQSLDFTRAMGLAFIDRKNRKLPVPAVYLVDENGLIHFNYVNPNYKVRPDPELLLKAAEIMMKN